MGLKIHTKKTDYFEPDVEFKPRLKKILISGVSRMPDPGEYYNELAMVLENHFREFKNNLFLEFNFDYINTGSSKWLYYILQRLENILNNEGGNIQVQWKFEADDETIEETGQILQSQLSIPFILQPLV